MSRVDAEKLINVGRSKKNEIHQNQVLRAATAEKSLPKQPHNPFINVSPGEYDRQLEIFKKRASLHSEETQIKNSVAKKRATDAKIRLFNEIGKGGESPVEKRLLVLVEEKLNFLRQLKPSYVTSIYKESQQKALLFVKQELEQVSRTFFSTSGGDKDRTALLARLRILQEEYQKVLKDEIHLRNDYKAKKLEIEIEMLKNELRVLEYKTDAARERDKEFVSRLIDVSSRVRVAYLQENKIKVLTLMNGTVDESTLAQLRRKLASIDAVEIISDKLDTMDALGKVSNYFSTLNAMAVSRENQLAGERQLLAKMISIEKEEKESLEKLGETASENLRVLQKEKRRLTKTLETVKGLSTDVLSEMDELKKALLEAEATVIEISAVALQLVEEKNANEKEMFELKNKIVEMEKKSSSAKAPPNVKEFLLIVSNLGDTAREEDVKMLVEKSKTLLKSMEKNEQHEEGESVFIRELQSMKAEMRLLLERQKVLENALEEKHEESLRVSRERDVARQEMQSFLQNHDQERKFYDENIQKLNFTIDKQARELLENKKSHDDERNKFARYTQTLQEKLHSAEQSVSEITQDLNARKEEYEKNQELVDNIRRFFQLKPGEEITVDGFEESMQARLDIQKQIHDKELEILERRERTTAVELEEFKKKGRQFDELQNAMIKGNDQVITSLLDNFEGYLNKKMEQRVTLEVAEYKKKIEDMLQTNIRVVALEETKRDLERESLINLESNLAQAKKENELKTKLLDDLNLKNEILVRKNEELANTALSAQRAIHEKNQILLRDREEQIRVLRDKVLTLKNVGLIQQKKQETQERVNKKEVDELRLQLQQTEKKQLAEYRQKMEALQRNDDLLNQLKLERLQLATRVKEKNQQENELLSKDGEILNLKKQADALVKDLETSKVKLLKSKERRESLIKTHEKEKQESDRLRTSSETEISGLRKELESRAVLRDEKEILYMQKIFEMEARISVLDKELERQLRFMKEKDEGFAKQLAALERENASLSKKKNLVDELRIEVQNYKMEEDRLENEVRNLRTQLDFALSKSRENEISIEEKRSEVSEKTREVEVAQSKLKSALSELNKKKEELVISQSAIREKEDQLEVEKLRGEKSQKKFNVEFNNQKLKVNELAEQVINAKKEEKVLEARVVKLKQTIVDGKKKLTTAESSILLLEEENAQVKLLMEKQKESVQKKQSEFASQQLTIDSQLKELLEAQNLLKGKESFFVLEVDRFNTEMKKLQGIDNSLKEKESELYQKEISVQDAYKRMVEFNVEYENKMKLMEQYAVKQKEQRGEVEMLTSELNLAYERYNKLLKELEQKTAHSKRVEEERDGLLSVASKLAHVTLAVERAQNGEISIKSHNEEEVGSVRRDLRHKLAHEAQNSSNLKSAQDKVLSFLAAVLKQEKDGKYTAFHDWQSSTLSMEREIVLKQMRFVIQRKFLERQQTTTRKEQLRDPLSYMKNDAIFEQYDQQMDMVTKLENAYRNDSFLEDVEVRRYFEPVIQEYKKEYLSIGKSIFVAPREKATGDTTYWDQDLNVFHGITLFS